MEDKVFLWDFIVEGGPFMAPIIACSVLALAVFIERLFSLQRSKIIPGEFMIEVLELIENDRIPEAMIQCKKRNLPISRLAEVIIKNREKGVIELKSFVEDSGRREVLLLERFLSILSTIASISPLLGLLGTVWGMVIVFGVIKVEGVGDATSLAGGISQALNTTVAGLVVAIPSFIAYRYFVSKVEILGNEMEEFSLKLIETIDRKRGEARRSESMKT